MRLIVTASLGHTRICITGDNIHKQVLSKQLYRWTTLVADFFRTDWRSKDSKENERLHRAVALSGSAEWLFWICLNLKNLTGVCKVVSFSTVRHPDQFRLLWEYGVLISFSWLVSRSRIKHLPLNTEVNICVLSLIGMVLENRSILFIDIYKIFHEWINNNFNLFIYPLISSGIQKLYKIYKYYNNTKPLCS